MRLILASASPRRAELLRLAGFTFETLAVDVDETPLAGEAPERYVRRLSAGKSARALGLADRGANASTNHEVVVLGADTTVVVDEAILAKPDDEAHAREMLRRLSGRAHDVLTGVSLRRGAHEVGRVETTRVYFSRLTDADIDWYVGTGEPFDKAGAYGIQGHASRFIPRIEGSYSNVVGLPVSAVWELLSALEHST